jgi:hypothetical protein
LKFESPVDGIFLGSEGVAGHPSTAAFPAGLALHSPVFNVVAPSAIYVNEDNIAITALRKHRRRHARDLTQSR